MVHFGTKIPILYFLEGLGVEKFGNFFSLLVNAWALWYKLRTFGIFCGFLYILWGFGTFCGFWYIWCFCIFCIFGSIFLHFGTFHQDKSGNLGAAKERQPTVETNLWRTKKIVPSEFSIEPFPSGTVAHKCHPSWSAFILKVFCECNE
jgi:hypothetical protein